MAKKEWWQHPETKRMLVNIRYARKHLHKKLAQRLAEFEEYKQRSGFYDAGPQQGWAPQKTPATPAAAAPVAAIPLGPPNFNCSWD